MLTGSTVAVEAARRRPADVASIIDISAPIFTAEEAAALSATFAPLPLDETGSRFSIMWPRVLENRGPLARVVNGFIGEHERNV